MSKKARKEKPVKKENPVINVQKWCKKNAHLFEPPICNKLMFRKQLNVMFVGGPNTRKDFHIDCGEEFFYQMKGNIVLPTYQQGKRKDVHIKEGQCYLLRARVPHSPQRPEKGSLGLVIERQRIKKKNELDCLRFYVKDFNPTEADETKVLWEKWFHCSNLGTQLPPVIKEFESSQQFKTHVPDEKMEAAPIELDEEVSIPDPISLVPFVEKNKKLLFKHKRLDIYAGTQTQVRIMCGPFELRRKYHQETWIYCMKGECRIAFDYPSERETQLLSDGDCLLINKSEQYRLTISSDKSRIMSVSMDIGPPPQDMKAGPQKYDHEKKKDVPWENMKAEDPKYHKRLKDKGFTQKMIENIDADITLDKQ